MVLRRLGFDEEVEPADLMPRFGNDDVDDAEQEPIDDEQAQAWAELDAMNAIERRRNLIERHNAHYQRVSP